MAKQNKPFAFTEPKIKEFCQAVIDGDELPDNGVIQPHVGLVVRVGMRKGSLFSPQGESAS